MTDRNQIKKQMISLEAQIRHHQHLYYLDNQPEISDKEFDKLFKQLQKLESEYPEWQSPDSPTRSVGSDLENTFSKVRHLIPVLSLSNTYAAQEAIDWAKKLLANYKSKILIQWKIDGATLVLYYKAGLLVRAVTRGSGQVGDDVTKNALTIKNIPHVLRQPIDLVVRGEAYMTFEDFKVFNEEFGSIYANPRNLTSGSLKHKKSIEVAKRPIRWAAFECHFMDTKEVVSEAQNKPPKSLKVKEFKTDSESLEFIQSLGIPVASDSVLSDVSQLGSIIDTFQQKRKKSKFPIDGLVLKLDDLAARKEAGYTAHSPRWATSLKFDPELAQTTILDVEFFTGRTGRVTPRAKLQPVKLSGSTVSYATLHNEDYIKKLGIRIGAMVKISKRGEIIPAVEEVVDPGKGKLLKFIKKCPSCQSKLVREIDAAAWMCLNPDCSTKKLESIIFFCQRKQMDIASMGEKTCQILFENGFIQDLADIYDLDKHYDAIEALDGFGKKSTDLIFAGIQSSRQRPFVRVLASLGLHELGHSVAEILIQSGYTSIDSLFELVQQKDALEVLQQIDGIGPKTADAIITQLNNKEIIQRIKRLEKAGLQFKQKVSESVDKNIKQIFADQIWCVTGSFAAFSPRDLAMAEIKKRGGKTTTTVSSKTTHLLAGENPGSKLAKAQQLEIEVVLENDFIKMLES